jgi:adenosyl cobinamide kinase/adenosyl cobinamide phosphate guanylyltransferase
VLTLVPGGARSGKSHYARELCGSRPVVFVATARADGDPARRARIEAHRAAVARRAVLMVAGLPLPLKDDAP